MTLRSSDLQSDSDLDSIRNSCDVFFTSIVSTNGNPKFIDSSKSQEKSLLEEFSNQSWRSRSFPIGKSINQDRYETEDNKGAEGPTFLSGDRGPM